MSKPKKDSGKKKPEAKQKQRVVVTTRSTGGAGFDFEDQSAAWILVKMLRGILMPGVESSGVSLQMQTRALGWDIDDILVQCKGQNSEPKQLAISCKSNVQVTSSGLPSDFITAAWSLWRKAGPFQREHDCLTLLTRGSNKDFLRVWNDIKDWCADGNVSSAIANINGSDKHKKIYDSVQAPVTAANATVTDDDTVNLIRHLQVLPLDFQFSYSEHQKHAVAYCREMLQSGSQQEADKLWDALVRKAAATRITSGTIRLPELWRELSKDFDLKDHPDFSPSWEALAAITRDYKDTIDTAMPTGFKLARTTIADDLKDTLSENPVIVLYGTSGSGKSAAVKSILDGNFSDWRQVWFRPDDLDEALAERTRASIGLSRSLNEVLVSTTKKRNVLVIDAAERLNPDCEKRAKLLVSDLVSQNTADSEAPAWRVLIIGQTEAWANGKLKELSGASSPKYIEVSEAKPPDVREALRSSPQLAWLSSHDDAVAALGNLKTLAWVMKAESLFKESGIDGISVPAIADRLWEYWTGDKIKLKSLLMKLSAREAQFERSFPISELALEYGDALDESPEQFPLRENKKTSRVEFQHDLAADWARFQRLKEIKDDITQWAPFAGNPLWHNALRMLGQLLLREKAEGGTAWDLAFEAAEKTKETNPLVAHILLDALCLDPWAEHYLNERVDLLLKDNGARLNRLLTRFHHIATVPGVPAEALEIDPSLRLYFEAQHRTPI